MLTCHTAGKRRSLAASRKSLATCSQAACTQALCSAAPPSPFPMASTVRARQQVHAVLGIHEAAWCGHRQAVAGWLLLVCQVWGGVW